MSVAASVSQRLAAHAAGIASSKVSASTLHGAKVAILDTIAVAWAGTVASGCPQVYGLLAQRGGAQECTAWGHRNRVPAPSAALANGMAAAALEYDSMLGGFHSDACTLPAALAVAERERASGSDFLHAYVAGTDVACRLYASVVRPAVAGWWDTPLLGAFGASTCASLLLGLDEDRIAHALGLAFARTGGTLQLNLDTSLAKRLAAGQAAEAGVNAALLAKAGVTGPREPFEGEFGFYRVYVPADENLLFADPGQRFAADGMTLKPYPSCGCTHTAIAAVAVLMKTHGLQPGDIEGAHVSVSAFSYALVGSPFVPAADPQVAAQFSIRYTVACAVLRGGFALRDLEPDAIFDPVTMALAARVDCEVDLRNDSTRESELTLRCTGGRTFTLRMANAPGSPALPLSERARRDKIFECMSRGVRPLSESRIDAFMARVMAIEDLPAVGDLFEGM